MLLSPGVTATTLHDQQVDIPRRVLAGMGPTTQAGKPIYDYMFVSMALAAGCLLIVLAAAIRRIASIVHVKNRFSCFLLLGNELGPGVCT